MIPQEPQAQVQPKAHILDRTQLKDFPSASQAIPPNSSPEQHSEAKAHSQVSKGFHRVKAAVKDTLHIRNSSSTESDHGTAPTLMAAPPTGDQDARLVESAEEEHSKPTFKEIMQKPGEIFKSIVQSEGGSQVSASLIASEVSHGHDVKLVQAQDNLNLAATPEEEAVATQRLEELIETRQAMLIRWTMDRHVRCVRRMPGTANNRPDLADYPESKGIANHRKNWSQYTRDLSQYFSDELNSPYTGSSTDYPPVTPEVLQSSIERIVIASGPLQAAAMRLRHIHMWENPNDTWTHLAVYAVLWSGNFLFAGLVVSLLWFVIQRRLYPPTVEDMRTELELVENTSSTAHSLTNQIDKYGEKKWVDELSDTLGPWGLAQQEGIADNLEVLRNFYEWRDPLFTGITLAVLSIPLVTMALMPSWMLIKTATFLLGAFFFGYYPLSIQYPNNKFVLAPFRSLFWKIPTHSEWAISRLQYEGSVRRKDFPKQNLAIYTNPKTSESPSKQTDSHIDDILGPPVSSDKKTSASTQLEALPNKFISDEPPVVLDLSSYECISHKQTGKLTVSTEGLRFEPTMGSSKRWSVRYDELDHIKKVDHIVQIGPAQRGLEFSVSDELKYRCTNLKGRDEVFTQIIGYSALRWQISREA